MNHEKPSAAKTQEIPAKKARSGTLSASMPSTSPTTQYAYQVVIRPAKVREMEPGTMHFTVTNRWECQQVVFTTDWDGVLKRILVAEKDGVVFTLYPDKIKVEAKSVEIAREKLDWMIWSERYTLYRQEYVTEPAK
jgi:hypothetical protein